MAPKMESKIFLITKIEEKGLGCVAQKEIKRGALILREKPCLLQEVGLGSGSYVNDYFADIFKASYLPSKTALTNGSVDSLSSFLAYFLAVINSSKISGRIPFFL